MSRFPLIMLHHSGGNSHVFDRLVSLLPDEVEPVRLDLPGRGRRWRETPVHTAEEAVDDLAAGVERAGVAGEFALFGHSMGAYLGLALAARLERTTVRTHCSTLFASANAGPLCARPLFEGDPLAADDTEVLEVAERFGGLSSQVLANPQLRGRAAALLRADFAVCDDFVRTLRRTRTESRLVVCCGTEDRYSDEDLAVWGMSSTADTEVLRLAGDHFYLESQAEAVARVVTARLPLRGAGEDRRAVPGGLPAT